MLFDARLRNHGALMGTRPSAMDLVAWRAFENRRLMTGSITLIPRREARSYQIRFS